jgi:hypothetical protein
MLVFVVERWLDPFCEEVGLVIYYLQRQKVMLRVASDHLNDFSLDFVSFKNWELRVHPRKSRYTLEMTKDVFDLLN